MPTLASAYPSDIAVRRGARQQGAAFSVATLAALKALTTRPEVVIVETGQAKGVWQWEQGSSTTADDETVVQCTSGTAGRYIKIWNGRAHTTETLYNSDAPSFYADWYNRAALFYTLSQGDAISVAESGALKQAAVFQHVDSDTTNYQSLSYVVASVGVNARVFGNGSNQYKDFIGVVSDAVCQTAWVDRGAASYTGNAVQYGAGIALNELTVSNPSDAAAQSSQMVGWLITMSPKKANADASHQVHGLQISNNGKIATAVFEAYTAGTGGDPGTWAYWLKGDQATVTTEAIVMPASSSGNAGTIIRYDTNDYSFYDRGGNIFSWVIGGSSVLTASATALAFTGSFEAGTSLRYGGTGAGTQAAGTISADANWGMLLWARAGATADFLALNSAGTECFRATSSLFTAAGGVTAVGVVTGLNATAVGAGANTQAFVKASSTANLGVYYGTGDPAFSAAKGSLYVKTDATTTTTRLWVNTDGSTAWTYFTSNA